MKTTNIEKEMFSWIEGKKTIKSEPVETEDVLKEKFGISNEKILCTVQGKDGLIGIFSKKKDLLIFTDKALYKRPDQKENEVKNRINYSDLCGYVDSETNFHLYGIDGKIRLISLGIGNILSDMHRETTDLINKIQQYVLQNDPTARVKRDNLVDYLVENVVTEKLDDNDKRVYFCIAKERKYSEIIYAALYGYALKDLDRSFAEWIDHDMEKIEDQKLKGTILQEFEDETTKRISFRKKQAAKLEDMEIIDDKKKIDKNFNKLKKEKTDEDYKINKQKKLAVNFFDLYNQTCKDCCDYLLTLDLNILQNKIIDAIDEQNRRSCIIMAIKIKDNKMKEVYEKISSNQGLDANDCKYSDSLYLTPLHYAILQGNEEIALKIIKSYYDLVKLHFDDPEISGAYDYCVWAISKKMSREVILALRDKIPEIVEINKKIDGLMMQELFNEAGSHAMNSTYNSLDKMSRKIRDQGTTQSLDEINEKMNDIQQHVEELRTHKEDIGTDINQLERERDDYFKLYLMKKFQGYENNKLLVVSIVKYIMGHPGIIKENVKCPIENRKLYIINGVIYCFSDAVKKNIPGLGGIQKY